MRILTDVMKSNNYAAEPMLQSCGVKISSRFTQVEGRILSAPKLKVGNGDDVIPRNRRWNFNSKRYFEPVKIEDWAVVNFSARCDIRSLCRDLARFGEMKRIFIRPPVEVFEESPQFRRAPAPVRVDKMFEQIQARFPKDPPRFLLCLLPDRENCDIYGPWKRKNLAEFGIFNQCLAPFRVNEYLMNVLLKINAKLGGLNSLLAIEQSRNLPVVSKVPTITFGMDVLHASPGQSGIPSIAVGTIIGLLQKFWPDKTISDNHIQACKFLDESWSPKFTVIVAQKNHHTKFFQPGSQDNVPPGTIIDNGVCHPQNNDFYLAAHAGMIDLLHLLAGKKKNEVGKWYF